MTIQSGEDVTMTTISPSMDPMRGPRRIIVLMLVVIAVFVVGLLLWAHFVKLDITATGIGQVIPSSHVQTVQNLEGGIITEVLVKEGDEVQADQVVARIDSTGLASSYREDYSIYLRLSAKAARLTAETASKPLIFPDFISEDHKGTTLILEERKQLESRLRSLADKVAVLSGVVKASGEAIANARSRIGNLQNRLGLVREELSIVAPQVARGLVSTVEELKLKGQIAEIQEQITVVRGTILSAQQNRQEAEDRMIQEKSSFANEALEELGRVKLELDALEEKLVAHRDRVTRRDVRSPANGVVKRVAATMAGAVIRPGDPIMEIVPVDDTLLIEARINPRDIAFIHSGQTAQVRITAYDASIYGALSGKVDRVGADTIQTREGESYYPVKVRIDDVQLSAHADQPIIPGMVADVSIVTGTRTILDYLLKPITKLKDRALTER